MTVILQDPAGPRDPSARHAFPDPTPRAKPGLNPRRTLAAELLAGFRAGGTVGEISSELESDSRTRRSPTL
jgi:hypothetical protein